MRIDFFHGANDNSQRHYYSSSLSLGESGDSDRSSWVHRCTAAREDFSPFCRGCKLRMHDDNDDDDIRVCMYVYDCSLTSCVCVYMYIYTREWRLIYKCICDAGFFFSYTIAIGLFDEILQLYISFRERERERKRDPFERLCFYPGCYIVGINCRCQISCRKLRAKEKIKKKRASRSCGHFLWRIGYWSAFSRLDQSMRASHRYPSITVSCDAALLSIFLSGHSLCCWCVNHVYIHFLRRFAVHFGIFRI